MRLHSLWWAPRSHCSRSGALKITVVLVLIVQFRLMIWNLPSASSLFSSSKDSSLYPDGNALEGSMDRGSPSDNSSASIHPPRGQPNIGGGGATANKHESNRTVTSIQSSQSKPLHPLPPLLVPAEYSTVIRWDVPPNFTIFDQMPIRQFCRWRGGSSKKKRRFARANQWIVHEQQGQPHKNSDWTLLQMTYDCQRTMKESPFGTGNWVQLLYIMRLAVAGMPKPKMELATSCRDDTNEHPERLVMPWLMGHYSSTQTMKVLDDYFGTNQVSRRCPKTGWGNYPLGWMLPWIRQDLRSMALALVGLPVDDPSHPAHAWSSSQYNVMYSNDTTYNVSSNPLVPNVTMDDAVIHFRCGDIMTSEETYFRFIRYHEFSRRLDLQVASIGIVTQPFGKSDQARERDQASTVRMDLCKRVILGFRDHLQHQFPRARISIHNDPDETVALAYARLIMAKYQAFAWPDSSFSIYPAMASFGKSYHLLPLQSPYSYFVPKNNFLHEIKGFLDDDPLFEWLLISNEDALFGIETLHMEQRYGGDAVVEWFDNATFVKPFFPELKRVEEIDDEE